MFELFVAYYNFVLLHDTRYYRQYLKLSLMIEQAKTDILYPNRNELLGFYYYIKHNSKIAPWFLHLCVTDFCQLKCKHCYFGDYKRIYSMSPNNVSTIIDKFFNVREWFLKHGYNKKNTVCNIAGGEPLSHPNILNVIDVIPQKSFDAIKFLSNGFSYNPLVVEKLQNKSNKLLYQISIDGLEDNHNFIRGNDSYTRALRTIENLRKDFPELYIQISFNAHSKNYKDAYEVSIKMKELGCNKIFFDRYISYWNSGLKVLTQDEYNEYQFIINKTYDELNDNDFLVFRNRSMQFDNNYTCMAGVQNQVSTANGDRMACTRYHLKTGNFYEDCVETLVDNAIRAEIKTQLIPQECLNCKNMPNCKGGMRCMPYASHKNFCVKDFHCIRKEL